MNPAWRRGTKKKAEVSLSRGFERAQRATFYKNTIVIKQKWGSFLTLSYHALKVVPLAWAAQKLAKTSFFGIHFLHAILSRVLRWRNTTCTKRTDVKKSISYPKMANITMENDVFHEIYRTYNIKIYIWNLKIYSILWQSQKNPASKKGFSDLNRFITFFNQIDNYLVNEIENFEQKFCTK